MKRIVLIAKAIACLAIIATLGISSILVIGTLSMGSPLFNGIPLRDATIAALLILPLIQIAVVAFAAKRRKLNAHVAIAIYLTIAVSPPMALLGAESIREGYGDRDYAGRMSDG